MTTSITSFVKRVKSTTQKVTAIKAPPLVDKLFEDHLVYLSANKSLWCEFDDDEPMVDRSPGYWDLLTADKIAKRIPGSFILYDPAMDSYVVVSFK